MKHYTLTITLHEDLHIGTGLGSGDIDATQTRDRNGAPCLPATHIKGVLRAQAQTIMAQATRSHIAHMDQLFGAAGNAKSALVLTSAWLDDTSSKDTLVWGSTRIADTGTAAQDTLRFVEYVRAGSRFFAEAQLHTTDDTLADFFKHVVQRTTHLGHGRQRGHGRVSWEIKEEQPQAWRGQTSLPTQFPARLRLVLRNLEPLCLARTGQPGNVIPTEGFIRGRTLRGAFAALAIEQQDTELAQALHSAHISWGDALPLHQDANASNIQNIQSAEVCAIPLSIGTPKPTALAGILPWWAQERPSPCLGDKGEVERVTLQDNDNAKEKYKRPAADEFLYRSSAKDPWLRYKPKILQRLRTRVPDRDNKDQALFSNEEIAEKTSFLADVIVTDAAAAHTLAQALQRFSGAWLRMGRSSRPLEIQHGIWLKNLPQPGKPAPDGFTFMLESDCIVRDEFLHYHTRLDADLLAQLVRDAGDARWGKVETGKSFVDAHPVFGFNATTGLPRPVQIAMAAGSVIHVKGADAPRLRQALSRRWALGENVEEGFGRFRLDGPPLPKSANNRAAPAQTSINPPPSMCAQAKEWAGRLDHLADRTDRLKKVSASQLGEARERTLAAQTPEDIGQLFTRIENAAAKKGGKNWKHFTEKSQYPEFKTLVLHKAASSLHDAQQLLDYFFRWCRAHDQNDQSTDQGERS